MISKAVGLLVASLLLVSCGGAATSRRADCATLHAEEGLRTTLVDADCVAALFHRGVLRLPQLVDYGRPAFEILSVDPAVVRANYLPAQRDVEPQIFLKASETDETTLPSTVTVPFGDPRTVLLNGVEVRLDGPPPSRAADWVHDGIRYGLSVLFPDPTRAGRRRTTCSWGS
jgi:hypothetical protein